MFSEGSRPSAQNFSDFIDSINDRVSATKGNLKYITPDDILAAPTGNMVLGALVAGTYNNLKLAGGGAAAPIEVLDDDLSEKSYYENVEFTYSYAENAWNVFKKAKSGEMPFFSDSPSIREVSTLTLVVKRKAGQNFPIIFENLLNKYGVAETNFLTPDNTNIPAEVTEEMFTQNSKVLINYRSDLDRYLISFVPLPRVNKAYITLRDLVIDGADPIFISFTNALLFQANGGYRTISGGPYNFDIGNKIIYLSDSAEVYSAPNFDTVGAGEMLYLFAESFDTAQYYPRSSAYAIGVLNASGFVAVEPAFIKPAQASSSRWLLLEQLGLLPVRNYNSVSVNSEFLLFVNKYYARNEDVTICAIGDSIITDLGWNTPLEDAMYRPPFMTEDNLNAFLENKLRWREQQYNRFDVPGVFTETLGGGSSEVLREDGGIGGAWGIHGASYVLPTTKVIDGGTNAGVSYIYPAGMRRCNFILHTDYKWANETIITVAEGPGEVEVQNEDGIWVEANGYSSNLQESATLINDTFRKSQYQKRLNMRSLSSLSSKTITIQNVGAGRFAYWGIEYSPHEFLFSYIAASIGSQALYGLSMNKSWQVDAFNPDLILMEVPIINEGVQTGSGTASAGVEPSEIAQHYQNYIEDVMSINDCPILSFIAWGGAVMGIVEPVSGRWGYSTYNGKNVTVDDYIGALVNKAKELNVPLINFFPRFTEIAFRKAHYDGTSNIYTSAIAASGTEGNTFLKDSAHLNNYGVEILKRLIEPYFNF